MDVLLWYRLLSTVGGLVCHPLALSCHMAGHTMEFFVTISNYMHVFVKVKDLADLLFMTQMIT